MDFANLDTASSVILLLVGLGVFLLGFKFLGDSIEKLSASKLRALFNRAAGNRFAGVGVGALATAIVQSSSVTTVMVVGFVNAGVMTLTQAAAVIMGANIGTTITGWLVWLNQFNVMMYAMLLTLIGLILTMVTKNNKVNTAGSLVASLGLVFVGLEIMSGSMAGVANEPFVEQALTSVTNPLLLLLIGVAVTGIVQSSSAVTSVLIVMAQNGLLIGGGGNGILFVILGTNIGTCVTAVLSSIGANTNAKRACLYHLLFNVIGSIIFLVVFWIWDGFYDDVLMAMFNNHTTCITFFHTMFNVICTCLYLPFIKYLVKLTEIIIPDRKKNRKNKAGEGFMDKRLLVTPSLALGQLLKQTTYTAGIAVKCLNNAVAGFIAKDDSKLDDMLKDVQKVNDLSQEITGYLLEISAKDISLSDEKLVNVLHRDNSDIVRIADIAENIVGYTHKAIDETLVFSDVVKRDLNKLMKLLNEQYELVVDIVENNNIVKIKQSDELEQEIDASKKRLLDEHIERMARGECNAENNSLFVSLISNLERVGDHLSMMAHSVEEVV
ncbi:MAG TPA: Na/Pi cotransporter family protein [Candidatus Coproplasma stercoripullorum]|uniref:Na/Pi cotransporter family protein n=1 Tax=Candidatus Coproplasma stercoripullorum TaxID=2840751 RepID=A0A9D1AGS8_9FIRM|nr:Na/Pi cotransporter family protein [Candidatus Coproplasma stercoripullorum]